MKNKIICFFLSFILSSAFMMPMHTEAEEPYTEPPAGSDISFLPGVGFRTKKRSLPENKLSLEYWESTKNQLQLTGNIRDDILELSCFFHDPADVGNLISGSSAFSKTSLNVRKFMVHVLLKAGLKNFELYFASV